MKCTECGKTLAANAKNAKFCPECGRKVLQPIPLELAPLATSLPICKLGVAGIAFEESEFEGYINLNVVYVIRNNTPRDWQFVSVRMQVLDAGGCPIEETDDLVERPIKPGSDAVLKLASNGLNARQIESDASQVGIVIHAIAGVIDELELGEAAIPSAPYQSVQIQPRGQSGAVRMHGLSLWRRALDSDGETQVYLRSLMQNVLPVTIQNVEMRVTLKDAAGREIANCESGTPLPAGRTELLVSDSGYIKGAALSGATASIRARIYVPVAMAIAHRHPGQRQPAAASQSTSIRSPSPTPLVPPTTPVTPAPPSADPSPAHASVPASPSQGSGSPENIQAATERFLAAVKGKAKHRSIFARPDIVKYKLMNALASFAPGVDPAEALVLIDTTVFGSAKDGLLVTSSALYAKDLFNEPRKIPIQDVKAITISSGAVVTMLRINDFDFFDASGLKDVIPAFAEALATFCRDINS
jgi:hypothetical protein